MSGYEWRAGAAQRLLKLYGVKARVDSEIADIEAAMHNAEESLRRAKAEAKAAGARVRKQKVALCGTDGGYYRHRRTLNEDACDACKLAHRAVERTRKTRTREETNAA